jgi:NADP-dependent 3-hydroxy acid dehydrogenase YdfG
MEAGGTTMAGRLENKVALVTGATSGIGAVAAKAFAAKNARVVLSGRSLDRGEAVAGEIRQKGGDAVFIRADVTDHPKWRP